MSKQPPQPRLVEFTNDKGRRCAINPRAVSSVRETDRDDVCHIILDDGSFHFVRSSYTKVLKALSSPDLPTPPAHP